VVLFLLAIGAWLIIKKVNLLSMEWKAGEAEREASKPRRALPPGDVGQTDSEDGG